MAAKITSCDYINGSKNDEGLKGISMVGFEEIMALEEIDIGLGSGDV